MRNAIPVSVSVLLLLGACATQPTGPAVTVMPSPNKPFAVFQADQTMCKQHADSQVAGGALQANTQQILTTAISTVLTGGLGAAISGARGAGIGAGIGALGGTAVGAGPAGRAQDSLQQRYDSAYAQCMYSRGNQVPGFTTASAGYPPAYR